MDFSIVFSIYILICFNFNFLSGKICNSNMMDKNYDEMLKINFSRTSNTLSIDCINSKNNSISLLRKVFIVNSFQEDLYLNDLKKNYDSVYSNLIIAFENETKLFHKYLTGNLNIILDTGNHIVSIPDLKNFNSEFFRRMFINITISSLNNFESNLIFRTNQFYLFISKNIIIENIIFYGNDINYSFTSNNICDEKNLSNFCCEEKDFSELNNLKKFCYLKNQILTDFNKFNYGFINSEPIYDSQEEFIPNIIIKNCKFINFVLATNQTGFSILISISFRGFIKIESSSFTNNHFPQGFILYSKYTFILLYSDIYPNIAKNNIIKNNSLDNKELLEIFNCSFYNYNKYSIINKNRNLIYFNSYEGSFTFKNNIIVNVTNIDSFFYFENSDYPQDKIIKDSIFKNIFQSNFLKSISSNNIKIYNVSIEGIISSKINMINLQQTYNFSIILSNLLNIKLDLESNLFTLIDSNSSIIDSIFSNSIFKCLINEEKGFLFIFNSSFSEIEFKDYFIFFIGFQGFRIEKSVFSNLLGEIYLFVLFKSDFMIFENLIIENIKVYSLFFVDQSNIHKNNYVLLRKNTIFYIWEIDQTGNNIINYKSEIYKNTILISFFRDLSIQNVLFQLNYLYIFENIFLQYNSGGMVQMQYGVCEYLNSIFIDNFFLNYNKFQFVFEFSIQNILFVKSSYFENNGIIEKKLIYFVFTDNVLFSFWNIPYSNFDNVVMIATNKIEILAGLISAAPYGEILELYNSKFILLNIKNNNFEYKGIQLDHFTNAEIINCTFYNLKCNNKTFANKHGGVCLLSAAKYTYSKGQNNYQLFMKNNSFFNSSCINGGGLAIIGIMNITLIDNFFIQSESENFGGSIGILGAEFCLIKNLLIKNSKASLGGAISILNIINVKFENVDLENILTHGKGGIYIENINSFIINDLKTLNCSSLFKGGVFYIINSYIIADFLNHKNSKAIVEGGVFLYDKRTLLFINNLYVNNSFSHNGAVISILEAKIISINNSIIMNTESEINAAFINIILCYNTILYNVTLINTLCRFGRGTIYIQNLEEIPIITIININFVYNFANEGSSIYYNSMCFLNIMNINIINNDNSPIFIFGLIMVQIFINNLNLSFCASTLNIIYLSSIILISENFSILNNIAIDSILFITDSLWKIKDILFANNNDIKMINIASSIINITNIKMNNQLGGISFFFVQNTDLQMNLGTFNGGIRENEKLCNFIQSNLNFCNLSFINNIGQILSLYNSLINIDNCIFINNSFQLTHFNQKANDISIENLKTNLVNINIYNTTFHIYNGFSCFFSGNLNISLNNVSFQNQAQYLSNFACLSELIPLININNAIFSNFTDKSFKILSEDAIFNSQLIIKDTIFRFNQAEKGSSLYLVGNIRVNISNTIFLNNRAIILENKTLEGTGSCIFFLSKKSKLSYISIQKCVFINNTADYLAPTIFSLVRVLIDKESEFINNLDKLNFTKKVFSYPINLVLISFTSENETILLNNTNNNDRYEFNSGSLIIIKFGIFDYFNQLINFDNSTLFSIKQSNENNITISLQNTVNISSNGIISFDELIIKVIPNKNISLIITGIFSAFPSVLDNIKQEFEFNLKLYSRKCREGEIITPDSSCIRCPDNTYSLIDPMITEIKYHKCYICPLNSLCIEGKFILPLSGYFKFLNTSTSVVKCLSSDSCLGIHVEKDCDYNCILNKTINGVCFEGNFGPLCSYCEQHFGRYEKDEQCKKCADLSTLIFLRMFGYFILMAIYLILNSYFAEQYSQKQSDSLIGLYIKIIVNHCQQLNIIFISGLNLPLKSISEFFKFSDYISFTNDQVITNECLFQHFYYDNNIFYMIKILINTILPIVLSITAFLIWTLYNYIKEKKNKGSISKSILLSKFKLFSVLSIFIFYPLIIKSSLGLFECMELDPKITTKFLILSLDTKCWERSHLTYLAFFALPGLLLWGIGFPLFLYLFLRKHFKTLSKLKSNNSISISKKSFFSSDSKSINKSMNSSTENVKIVQTYSFFYKGYKIEYFYWESLIFLRKLLLTLISTLNQSINEESKWTCIIIILFSYLYLTINNEPYSSIQTNNTEILSLISCIVVAFSLINYDSNSLDQFKILVISFAFIIQFLFFIFCIYKIGHSFHMQIKKGSNFKKIKMILFQNKKKGKGK